MFATFPICSLKRVSACVHYGWTLCNVALLMFAVPIGPLLIIGACAAPCGLSAGGTNKNRLILVGCMFEWLLFLALPVMYM